MSNNPIQEGARGFEISIWFSRGGDSLTLNNYLANREIFKAVIATTTGVIVYEKIDGTNGTIPAAIPGVIYPVWGRRIVTGTTATGVYWYGGD